MANRDKATLNIQEVADMLGVDRRSISAAAKMGRIPCIRLTDRVMFSRKAIENFVNTGSFDGSASSGPDPVEFARQTRKEQLLMQRAVIDAELERIDAVGK